MQDNTMPCTAVQTTQILASLRIIILHYHIHQMWPHLIILYANSQTGRNCKIRQKMYICLHVKYPFLPV